MKKGKKVIGNCKTAAKDCRGCDWLAVNKTCFATECVLAGKKPGFYLGKHENCPGCGDCLADNTYLVAVDQKYVGAEIPTSPETKENSDAWYAVNGDLIIGQFNGANEKQAIAIASETEKCPETMLKAWKISNKIELTPEEENMVTALRAAEIEPEKALGHLYQYFDEWADDMADDPEPIIKEEELRKKAEILSGFID